MGLQCPFPNILFNSYAKTLKHVSKAGSSAETNLGSAVIWFTMTTPRFIDYYTYQGIITDWKTGKKYNARKIIINHSPGACVSKQQVNFHCLYLQYKRTAPT